MAPDLPPPMPARPAPATAPTAFEPSGFGPTGNAARAFAPATDPVPAQAARTVVSAPPARRFAEDDLVAPRTGPRIGLIVGLAIVTVVAITAVTVVTLLSNRAAREAANRAAAAPPSATAKPTPTPTIGGPPRGVQLNDRGTSITLSWIDPSGGQVSFLIGGTDPAGRALTAQQVPQGQTTVTFTGVKATGQYCFVVGAIYSVRDVSRAPQVCTKR
jgi:hypothetical protein